MAYSPQPTRPEDLRGFNGRVVTCHGHGSSAPVRSKRRWQMSRSLAPGPTSTSPPKLSGRARPGQWARRAECWRRGIDGGPFGWTPGPDYASVDANGANRNALFTTCNSRQLARVIKVRRTPKWSPPLRLRGHENGPRRRVPGELPGTQPSAANTRAQNLDCVDQTRSPPTIPQPRPASRS
jgi:hypothetical protein